MGVLAFEWVRNFDSTGGRRAVGAPDLGKLVVFLGTESAEFGKGFAERTMTYLLPLPGLEARQSLSADYRGDQPIAVVDLPRLTGRCTDQSGEILFGLGNFPGHGALPCRAFLAT